MSAHQPVEVLAMHGWASDARCWEAWRMKTEPQGWRWHCGERGYGAFAPHHPTWPTDLRPNTLRVVIGHSLGPHLLAPESLAQANAIVLLASFAAFVPPDRTGRRVQRALAGMTDKLETQDEARDMLHKFFAKAAAPESADLLPPGPTDGTLHLGKLREDLRLLSQCQDLPIGFPAAARVLLIEAECDEIVTLEARALLREALPQAEVVCLQNAGHSLLRTDVIPLVTSWVHQIKQTNLAGKSNLP